MKIELTKDRKKTMKRLVILMLLLATAGESRPVKLTTNQQKIYVSTFAAATGILTTICLYHAGNKQGNDYKPFMEKLLAVELVHKQFGLKFDRAKYIKNLKIKHAIKCMFAGLCVASAAGIIAFLVSDSHFIVEKERTRKKHHKNGYLPNPNGFLGFWKKELQSYDLYPK